LHVLHHLEYLHHHWADTKHLLTYNNKCPSLVSAADSCISTAPSLICTQRFESSGSQFIQHYTTQTKQAPCVVSINPPSDYLPIHPPPSTPHLLPLSLVLTIPGCYVMTDYRHLASRYLGTYRTIRGSVRDILHYCHVHSVILPSIKHKNVLTVCC